MQVVLVLGLILGLGESQIDGPIIFPDTPNVSSMFRATTLSGLPPAEPCPPGQLFCGNEAGKYPEEELQALVRGSILPSSPEVQVKFFGGSNALPTSPRDQGIEPACGSSIQYMPRFARARNLKGKWKYILENKAGVTQHVAVVLCDNPGDSCRNHRDSPSGNTFCRQLYKTQRLLASDEGGEIVVDSFDLPSACVCHHSKTGDVFNRNGFEPGLTVRSNAKCSSVETSLMEQQPSEFPQRSGAFQTRPSFVKPSVVRDLNLLSKRRFFRRRTARQSKQMRPAMLGAKSCMDPSMTLCDDGIDQNYPAQNLRNVLRRREIFNNQRLFSGIFGPTCINEAANELDLRTSFNLRETELCPSDQKYIWPDRAQNTAGQWRYIVNIDGYRQGVTIRTCKKPVEEESCTYSGEGGNVAESTVCKQLYATHEMIAATDDGTDVYIDTFKIPSACVCHINFLY